MTENKVLNLSLDDHIYKRAEAQASFGYPTTIDFYSQALAGNEIDLELECEVLDQMAKCFQHLGNYTDLIGNGWCGGLAAHLCSLVER